MHAPGGLVELLRQAGFEIVGEAADGADAVALAKQLEPDVVLMDLRMPVLAALTPPPDQGRLPRIQVVLLTALREPGPTSSRPRRPAASPTWSRAAPRAHCAWSSHQAVAARRALSPPGSPVVDA
jgi:DNA-binding NarL/FixJ family response regulator